jgi:cystathionine beta-synthase
MGMEKFNQTVLDIIGNTPIVKLQKVAAHVDSEIYVKLEYMNPGGSIKDRIGYYILKKAVESGKLKPGGTIIEGTSGNTGFGLAMFAAIYGYKSIFVLADKQSKEKIDALRAFGSKVIVCPTNVEPDDPQSYYSVSKRLAESIPNSLYVNQYDNPDNAETHYVTTGPEIFQQTGGAFDVFMAGVGTGGTISGSGKYLKEKMPDVKVVGVDIVGSILGPFKISGKVVEAKAYVLEGIGEDIFPENVVFDVIDDFVMVEDRESFLMTRKLLTQEGIYAGGSSGAAVVGAIRYAETLKTPQKIVVILPDSGNRYASKIYNDDWMRDNNYLDLTFNVQIKEVLTSLRKDKPDIISVEETCTVEDAIKLMEDKSISQLPIVVDDVVIGVVSEADLLRPVFEGKLTLNDNVSVAHKSRHMIVDINEMLEKVARALTQKETVLITENGKIVDILTNIDILHYVSSNSIY